MTGVDPMELTAAHVREWRSQFDTIGSSQSRSGLRKTFALNPDGWFVVREFRPTSEFIIYEGRDEAEALAAYRDA